MWAYCYRRSNMVHVSVGHIREPCKNGWTNPDADQKVDLGGPKESCYNGVPQRQFLGVVQPTEKHCRCCSWCCKKSMIALQCHCCSGLQCCRLVGVTLHCPPWNIHPLRCGLSSKFFDHLLTVIKRTALMYVATGAAAAATHALTATMAVVKSSIQNI